MTRIRQHQDLTVFVDARDAAMRLYELSRGFPREERYSLTSQMVRSSRSVCANIAEAWQKRRYPAAFVAKLLDAAGEADETRVWIDFASRCGFLDAEQQGDLERRYNRVLGKLVRMLTNPADWRLK